MHRVESVFESFLLLKVNLGTGEPIYQVAVLYSVPNGGGRGVDFTPTGKCSLSTTSQGGLFA